MWSNVRVSQEQRLRIDGVRGDVPLARWVANALEVALMPSVGPAPAQHPDGSRPRPADRPRVSGKRIDPAVAARQERLNS